MNDTLITLHGWAGSEVRHRVVKDVSVATFRVAATPRVRRDGAWVDAETTWFSVTAWRTLADHVRNSVRKGEPVIVHGRLRTETWKAGDGTTSTTLHIEASLVGHDLSRGLSHYMKPNRSDRAPDDQRQDTPPTVAAAVPDPAEADAAMDAPPADGEGPEAGEHVAA